MGRSPRRASPRHRAHARQHPGPPQPRRPPPPPRPADTLTAGPDAGWSEDGEGLTEDGPGLREDGAGLTEDGPGLSEDGAGLTEDGPGLREDGAGLTEDGPGLSEDGAGLTGDGPGLREDGAGLTGDGPGLREDACCWLVETNGFPLPALMETSGFPLFDLTLAGSRSTAGFAHPAGCGGAKRCFAKPRLRPGGRPTFLRRQESRQRSDPCFTGHPLRG